MIILEISHCLTAAGQRSPPHAPIMGGTYSTPAIEQSSGVSHTCPSSQILSTSVSSSTQPMKEAAAPFPIVAFATIVSHETTGKHSSCVPVFSSEKSFSKLLRVHVGISISYCVKKFSIHVPNATLILLDVCSCKYTAT